MRTFEKIGRAEISASSMADIAFLLLTFFMVTTIISNEKGLPLLLPPIQTQSQIQPVPERNLFKILINSNDQLLIEGTPRINLDGVRDEIKSFVLNEGGDPELSTSPVKAIVSLKADRGTSHGAFVTVLDEIQGAYYEIYAERVGLSPGEYRALDLTNPSEKNTYDKAREGIPMNISIAEATRSGSD